MMNKLLLGASVMLVLAGCATSPRSVTAANAAPAGCVPQTASRIPADPSTCAGFGRTYTQQDIQRTGATDSAQALRLLDPSVTIQGH